MMNSVDFAQRFEKGKMIYKHVHFLSMSELLCGYRYLGETRYGGSVLAFGIVPIGGHEILKVRWADECYTIGPNFMETPSERWMVLDGLGLPDELTREVYWFVNKYDSQEKRPGFTG